jgi:hypothetical protein
MLFTLLYITLFFTGGKRRSLDKRYEDIEIIDTENPLNHYGMTNNEDYWRQIQKELLIYSLKCIGIVVSIYFDIIYIYKVYFQTES